MKRTVKKAVALFMAVCLALSLMPAFAITASAETTTVDYCMDFYNITTGEVNTWAGTNVHPDSQDCSGTGWSWDVSEKTLTLSGLDFTTSNKEAISLPADSTIVVPAGTVNNFTCTYDGNENTIGIYASGNLTIKGGGTLKVTPSTRSTLALRRSARPQPARFRLTPQAT